MTLFTSWCIPPSSSASLLISAAAASLHQVFAEGFTLWASLVAQTATRPPALWETRFPSLGGEDPPEKETATRSSILAWKIPWMQKHSPRGCKESDTTKRLHSLYMHYLIWCNQKCTTRQCRQYQFRFSGKRTKVQRNEITYSRANKGQWQCQMATCTQFYMMTTAKLLITLYICLSRCCFNHKVMSDSFATPWSLPGSSALGVSQARILESVVISLSRTSSWPKNQTWISCIGRWNLDHWTSREAWPSVI